jgi:MAP/microtubule affinity-regulating kinase
MPVNVGRGAELVLRGCLEASVTQRWSIAAVDDVSWSVGWGSDADDLSCATAESELDRIVHETHVRTQWPAPRSASFAPSVIPAVHDAASEDAVPELEDDAEPPRGMFARSTSSRSRSTGTGPFSPFTTAWSEIEMPSVGPPELTLPPMRSLLEHSRGRRAAKGSDSGWRSSLGPARSSSPSVAPISPASAEMRGRQGMDAPPLLPLGLGLSSARPKRAGSQPPPHSAPWATPSRSRASVGVSPALSVTRSTPHADGGFVLRSGVATARTRSVGRA